jgi:hypothetical protein
MTRHLIHVGYPKAGSTYLQRWFERHPQIAYLEGGVAGYRSVYDIVTEAASPPPVAPLWRVTSTEGLTAPVKSLGQWRAEAMHGRMAEIERACSSLAEMFPSATVAIVTRGFRSMILSSYSQYVRSGGTHTLEALMRHERGTDHPWNYDATISHYRARFGSENVIVLPYELLSETPARFLSELELRLGLEPTPAPADRINPSLSPAELAWYPRLAHAVNRLPLVGVRARRLLARATFRNRLSKPITVMQRLSPRPAVTAAMIDDDMLETFRSYADCLRDEPLYAPYSDDYLF